MKRKISPGDRFVRLAVVRELEPRKYAANTVRRFLCRCDCGAEKDVAVHHLVQGKTQSCGCLAQENRTKHGKHNSRAYRTWTDMKGRIRPETRCAQHYADRGIKVCERWQNFDAFYEDMGDPPPGMSLDRIDNDLGYSKENCRWATQRTQMINQRTRRTALSKYRGVSKHRKKWVASFSRSDHHKYIGIYETEELAREAYVAYCRSIGAEYR